MQSELKPCPFCGAKPHRGMTKVKHCQLHGDPYQDFRIWCPHGCARVERSQSSAITAWNTRASDAEITRLTEALRAAEEQVKGLREALEGMLEYATFSERWQDQHPEYLTIARAELERIADE